MYATSWSNLLLDFKCCSIGLPSCWILQPHAGQAKVVFSDWLCTIHSGILCDVQTHSGWCLKRVWSQKYHPFALMRHLVCHGTTWPQCHFSMQSFLKHLSLGKFSCQPSVFCVAHYWNCLFALTKKQMAVGPCQKSGERQQRCDNPRVKGVNMRREFHAWQVRRMAPVFSLFTHANEQYADEQTWAQPRLHAAQNWQEVCCCGSATSSRIPLVCCRFWWLFKRLMLFPLASEIPAMYCQ